MIIVFLAVLAASFSYLVNTLIIDKLGLSVLVDIIPFIEEFLKTFLAVIGNSSIIGVHILFGFIEAIIDYSAGEKKAAIFSIFSHAGFGILATLTYLQYGLFWSLAISTIMHMSYNKVMVTI